MRSSTSFQILALSGALILALIFAAPAYGQTAAQNRANPDLSINLLTLARAGTDGASHDSEAPNGLSIQEVEIRGTSNIDTYFRGDVTVAFHPAHAHEGEEAHGFEVDIEEAFAETLSISSLTLKAGKFYAPIGRHNGLHTHVYPFIDKPLTNEAIFGEEGLNEIGLSAGYLAPTPWYLEVIAHGMKGDNETLFGSETNDDVAGLLTIRNLWDLSDSATFALDLSGAGGKNAAGGTTSVYSLSAGYKWRPIEKTAYKSFSLIGEYLFANPNDSDTPATSGLATWAQYQFAKEWWLQGRYEFLTQEIPKGDPMLVNTRISGLVGYVPTEYSALRLQYDNIRPLGGETEHRVTLQLNVSMGAHPAHGY